VLKQKSIIRLPPGANGSKVFFLYHREFVPGKPFQPSLLFTSMAGAYPSDVPFMYSSLG
jgi:hypothetical protein